jgi:hypothetical protein
MKWSLPALTVVDVNHRRRIRMNEDRLSRIGPLSGVLFVVLELAGALIGSAGGRDMLTLGDPTSKVLKAFADPVGSGVWIGAYLELLSLAAFVVFAVWLFGSRRGPLATAGLITAGVYAAITVVSLVIGDVLEYRAGHGMGAQEVLALFDLQTAMYTVTWGIGAAFLLLAPVTGWLRRSAQVIAALSLIGMAIPKAGPGQFAVMLFLVWIVVASIALARRRSAVHSVESVPAHA